MKVLGEEKGRSPPIKGREQLTERSVVTREASPPSRDRSVTLSNRLWTRDKDALVALRLARAMLTAIASLFVVLRMLIALLTKDVSALAAS